MVVRVDGEIHSTVTCSGCNFLGHYRSQCPYVINAQVQAVYIGCTLTQGSVFTITKSWILINTCSTCNVSNNSDLVSNFRAYSKDDILTAYTNGGAQQYIKLADLGLLPITVYFKENLMATILSLKSVSDIPGVSITLDTNVNKNINLSLKDGRTFVFKQYKTGLYFFDTNKSVEMDKNTCELNLF